MRGCCRVRAPRGGAKFTGRGREGIPGGAKSRPGRRPRPRHLLGDERVAGRERGLGLKRPEGWGPQRKYLAEGKAGELGGQWVVLPAPRSHSPGGPHFAAARRRFRTASSLGPVGQRAASEAPSNHAAPGDPRSHYLPRTARAPSGRTEGLEGAIAAGGRQARRTSGVVGYCARAVASCGWSSGRWSLEIKSLTGSLWDNGTLPILIPPNPYRLFLRLYLSSLP